MGGVPWSEADDKLLKKNYQDKTAKEIKGMLNTDRTLEAIKTRIHKTLGLKKMNMWSEEEEAILRKYYSSKPSKEVQDILDSDRSIKEIRGKANRLGLTKDSREVYQDLWSEKDLEYMRNNYPDKTNEEIQKSLENERTIHAIDEKARRMGLRKEYDGATRIKDHKLNEMTEKAARKWLEKEYHEKDKTQAEIAEDLGICQDTVGYWSEKLGIETRDLAEAQHRRYRHMTEEELGELIKKSYSTQRHQHTSIEKKLTGVLEDMGGEYIEQESIGRWVVDFLLPDRRLVIEADGVYWHSLDEVKERDKRKNTWLRKHGYEVLRLDGDTIRDGNVKSKVNSAMQYAAV